MNPNNNQQENDQNALNSQMQQSLMSFGKHAFPYPFNISTQFATGTPVAQLINHPNSSNNSPFPQFPASVQQIRPIQTQNAFQGASSVNMPQISSPLPSPTTPTPQQQQQQQQQQSVTPISKTNKPTSSITTANNTSGGSSSSRQHQQHAHQQQQQDAQENSFRTIFGKYQKKRSRNQLYNGNLSASDNSSDLEDKFDFLTQIISLQATKIRRLENRLRAVEEILPDYGSFSEQERLRLSYHQQQQIAAASTGNGASADASSDPSKKEKRPKTEYQIFMSEEIPRIRSQNPDIPQKEAFSVAAKNWSLKKESDQKLKDSSSNKLTSNVGEIIQIVDAPVSKQE